MQLGTVLLLPLRKGDVLYVYKLDRIARTVMMIIKFVELLQKREIDLVVVQEPIDTTSAIGRMMMHVIATFAQLERDLISERTKAGLEAKRKQGVVMGAPKKLTEEMWYRAVDLRKEGLSCPAITAEINKGLCGKKSFPTARSKIYAHSLMPERLTHMLKKNMPLTRTLIGKIHKGVR